MDGELRMVLTDVLKSKELSQDFISTLTALTGTGGLSGRGTGSSEIYSVPAA